MSKLLELKRSRKELVDRLDALAQNDAPTPEEETAFIDLRTQVDGMDRQIERLTYVEGRREELARVETVPARPRVESEIPRAARSGRCPERKPVENPGFENVGELVAVARFNPHDARIQALMEMDTGESGGIAIPDDINPTLREVMPQEAIMRPRATVVPPGGESPDADLVLPSLNQGVGANMYGGVQVDWIGEGGEKPETNAQIKETRWTPKEVAAHIVVTDKLLRNWRAASPFIERMLRGALLAAEDVAFLRGNGVGRPKGVLSCDALKKVNRAGAGAITYEDLTAMEAELHEDGEAIWIVSPRAIPQLRTMKDDAGRYIWVGDRPLSEDPGGVSTLLGRPVLKNYRSPALGDLGDVLLLVPSYYVIKDGVQTTIAASEHVLFKQNKTVVKAFKTVDGGPWLDGPIAQEDGETYSPFVALDVPA